MIVNTYINYGGRYSRLCYLVPLLVHTMFIYLGYFIYFNVEIINIYILLIFIIFVNLEWPLVIIYEYIYLTNYNIQNNLLYNIGLFIFLEILLFGGFYWLYVNNIIHYPNNFAYNTNININLIDHINHNTNPDIFICLYIIIYNLLILLYVTLILQLVHRYLFTPSVNNNNHNNCAIINCNLFIFILCNIFSIFSIFTY